MLLFLVFLPACRFNSYDVGMGSDESSLDSPLTPPSQDSAAKGMWKVAPDIQLYHFSEGRGKPVLVLHGGPGIPPEAEYPGLGLLGHEFEFHYYHQRGCGKSSRPVDRLTENYYKNSKLLERKLGLSAQIADIERIRRILGVEKITIVGHSFGGFLGLLYAIEFPDRVEKLVLVAPAGVIRFPPTDGGLFEQVRSDLPAEKKDAYAAFLKRYLDFGNLFDHDEAYFAAMNREFGSFYLESVKKKNMQMGESVPAANFGGWMPFALYMSLGKSADYSGELKKIRAKTLLIVPGRDIAPASSYDDYKLIPGVQTVVMENSGHFPFYDDPGRFSSIVEAFLK